jgi:DNA repair protein RadC
MKPHKLCEYMQDELPREKLFLKGPQSLVNFELLALLLRTGTKDKNVLELSREVMKKFSTREISQKTFQELLSIKGISHAKASIIIAAFELSRRLSQQQEKIKLDSSQGVFAYLKEEMVPLLEERVICLFVNAKMTLIKKEVISQGSLTFSFIEPRKVMQKALEYNAYAFFLIHNHPSGDPTPSQEDIRITKRIKEISNLMHVFFLDHIIIGETYYSFYDNDNL